MNNEPIVPFWGYSAFAPTIPKLYWDVKSQEQRILNLFDLLDKLVCYANDLGARVNVNASDIAELKAEFEKFKESGYLDYYQAQLEKWFKDNAYQIYQLQAKQVYFGLTDDGHFCAYVPEGWNEIIFDTGAVFGRSDYGRLCLKFDASGAIDNTYGYSLAKPTKVETLIADLENNVKRTDAAYDALFTNVSESVSKVGEA